MKVLKGLRKVKHHKNLLRDQMNNNRILSQVLRTIFTSLLKAAVSKRVVQLKDPKIWLNKMTHRHLKVKNRRAVAKNPLQMSQHPLLFQTMLRKTKAKKEPPLYRHGVLALSKGRKVPL